MTLKQKLRYPLRSLFAILIGLIIFKLLNQPFGYWILLTIVVLLQSTTGATFFRTTERVVGTLFGVLMGAMLIALIPYNAALYYIIIIASLFLLIYFVVISYQKCMFFLGIFLIFILSLFISHGNQAQALIFASVRFLDTLIAATIVLTTTYLFWPDHAATHVQDKFYKVLGCCDNLVKELSIASLNQSRSNRNLDDFYQAIGEFKLQANDAKFGIGDYVTKEQVLESIVNNMLAIYSCFVTIQVNQLTVVTIPQIGMANLQQKLLEFIHSLSGILNDVQTFTKIHKTDKDWQNMIVMLLRLTEEITEYESQHGYMLLETYEGMRFTMLLINLRQICIDLQFIFTAVAQLRMR